jgi:hypothetical protein
MKKRFYLVALSAIALGFSGCATILGGGSAQSISIYTIDGKQAEATVSSVNGMQNLSLPATILVKRDNVPLTVTVKETANVNAGQHIQPSRINLWFFGNLAGLYFAPLSSTTDAINGSMWTYDQNMLVPVSRK